MGYVIKLRLKMEYTIEDPFISDVFPLIISGLMVRTRLSDEEKEETAKIGNMWQKFCAEGVMNKIAQRTNQFVYGVYHNYESGDQSCFDATAGVAVLNPDVLMNTVEIQGGKYLVFRAMGELPFMVIRTWQEIHQYFKTTSYKRKFATDFEIYTSDTSIDVYVGIED